MKPSGIGCAARAAAEFEESAFLDKTRLGTQVSTSSIVELPYNNFWTLPTQNVFKVNVGASWGFPAGFGFVFRDSSVLAGARSSETSNLRLVSLLSVCWAIEEVCGLIAGENLIVEGGDLAALLAAIEFLARCAFFVSVAEAN